MKVTISLLLGKRYDCLQEPARFETFSQKLGAGIGSSQLWRGLGPKPDEVRLIVGFNSDPEDTEAHRQEYFNRLTPEVLEQLRKVLTGVSDELLKSAMVTSEEYLKVKEEIGAMMTKQEKAFGWALFVNGEAPTVGQMAHLSDVLFKVTGRRSGSC